VIRVDEAPRAHPVTRERPAPRVGRELEASRVLWGLPVMMGLRAPLAIKGRRALPALLATRARPGTWVPKASMGLLGLWDLQATCSTPVLKVSRDLGDPLATRVLRASREPRFLASKAIPELKDPQALMAHKASRVSRDTLARPSPPYS
jgi:hypothetical protein